MTLNIPMAVIPAAGGGTRIRPFSTTTPKPMIPVRKHPLLEYTIRRALKMGVKHVILIVGHHGEQIVSYFSDPPSLGLRCEITFIKQHERLGIAHALQLTEEIVSPVFICLLGDELYIDSDHEKMPTAFTAGVNAVIGLMHTQNTNLIRRNYSVELTPDQSRITNLIEKPTQLLNNILGVGSYIFDHRIFDAIKQTPLSAKNEIEITDAINVLTHMDGVIVRPYFLQGRYLNITYPEDLQLAEELLKTGRSV